MRSEKKAYFISDLHLGAKYIHDSKEAERRIVRFLDSIKDDASEIYLVGDILDYWFEYKYVVPKGHIRFLGKLAELADSGIKITWLIGNHDIWIYDYLPNELGISVVDGSQTIDILGKRFFITHGDGVGDLPFTFKLLRNLFRNRFCQKLYSSIHPRWTIPFALGWSKSSRYGDITPEYKGINNEPLMQFAKSHNINNPDIDYYIFGHRHILQMEQINPRATAVILGEWISICSYAVFDGESLELNIWDRSKL